MAFDPGLAERVRERLAGLPGITERRMFGGLAFLHHGHMVAGLVGETLMLRVGPDGYTGALARPHVRPMDFTGRPMKGYVYVDPPGTAGEGALAQWVGMALAFVATLPPKATRAAARPSRKRNAP